jgi:hypothetical protein
MLGFIRWLLGAKSEKAPEAGRYFAGRLYVHQADDTFYVDAKRARVSFDDCGPTETHRIHTANIRRILMQM